jgi:phage terminase large subunit-like protein
MGSRGRGSLLTREEREQAQQSTRRLPWKKKGLSRVERVVAFLQFLPVTKGILRGKRMRLLEDQREFVELVYGPKKKDGRRQVSLAIKSAPKGNGKTGLVAGLALCHLLGPESEIRGEVYSAAIDRQQAGIMFNEMEAIIHAVPEFAARVNLQRFNKKIEVLEGEGALSVYEALSADARRAHGLAPSLWVYDELAQARDRTLLDNLVEGMGKRSEALGIVISTQAASDDHPLSQLIDDAEINRGNDPSTVLCLLTAPIDADPFDDEVLRSVNPAWGKYLDLDDLQKSKERARRSPAFEPAYRNLRLNQRVDSNTENRIVTLPTWKLGAASVDRAALRGKRCYAALDLSGKHDLTALVLAFPTNEPEPRYDILPFFWTPEGRMIDRKQSERERFREWIAAGHMILVPGPTIRFAFVARELVKLSQEFEIVVLGYDRWRIDDFKQELNDIDADFEVPLEPFGQGYKEMGPAVERFAELALTARLHHGGHPVLTAAVANAITTPDPAGNLKIDKERSNNRSVVRVDGAVALAMALELAHRFIGESAPDLDDWLRNAVMA